MASENKSLRSLVGRLNRCSGAVIGRAKCLSGLGHFLSIDFVQCQTEIAAIFWLTLLIAKDIQA